MNGDKFGDCVWDFIHETVNVDICDPREIMFAIEELLEIHSREIIRECSES